MSPIHRHTLGRIHALKKIKYILCYAINHAYPDNRKLLCWICFYLNKLLPKIGKMNKNETTFLLGITWCSNRDHAFL